MDPDAELDQGFERRRRRLGKVKAERERNAAGRRKGLSGRGGHAVQNGGRPTQVPVAGTFDHEGEIALEPPRGLVQKGLDRDRFGKIAPVKEEIGASGGLSGPAPLKGMTGGLLETGKLPAPALEPGPDSLEKRLKGENRAAGIFCGDPALIGGLVRWPLRAGKINHGRPLPTLFVYPFRVDTAIPPPLPFLLDVRSLRGRAPAPFPPVVPGSSMDRHNIDPERILRDALDASGQRFTEQRAAVFRYLLSTDAHPTADEVFVAVRAEVPVISLATVYKSLETLVGCGLATKLTYGDGSARYDGRTDPHHHARCLSCSRLFDVSGHLPPEEIHDLNPEAEGFQVTGYRLEFTGYCEACTRQARASGTPLAPSGIAPQPV